MSGRWATRSAENTKEHNMRNWAKHVSRTALVAGGLTAMGTGLFTGSALAAAPATPHACAEHICHDPVPVPHMPGRPYDYYGHPHSYIPHHPYGYHEHSYHPRPYYPHPYNPRPYYSEPRTAVHAAPRTPVHTAQGAAVHTARGAAVHAAPR
ncbi:hypothetical protein DZF91_24660, partial [Actinomadura logoneensis]